MMASEVKRGVERGALAPVDVPEALLTLWAAMHGVASLVALRRIRVHRDSLSAFVDRTIGHTVRGLETADRTESPRST